MTRRSRPKASKKGAPPDCLPKRMVGEFGASAVTAQESGEIRDHFPLHWHDFYELELVAAGRGRHIINGVSADIGEGSLYLLIPTDLHEIAALSPMRFLNIKIAVEEAPHELRALIDSRTRWSAARFEGDEYAALLADFRRVLWETRHHQPGRDIVVTALVQKILVDLFRKTVREPQAERCPALPALDKIQRSIIHINHHFTGPVTLGGVAALSGYSPNYFSHVFARTTGKTFQEYVAGLRMGFAKSLLSGTGLPVEEIGAASGYESLSHFLRTFKKQCGTTPARYRKAHAGGAYDAAASPVPPESPSV